MKKGFSLTELMIALTVIGIIASLSIPVITKSISDTNRSLFKSAVSSIETVVSELVSDTSLYPSGELDGNFCNDFVNKVNTIGSSDCTTSTYPTIPNFTTSNGMRWYRFDRGGTTFVTTPASNCMISDINGIEVFNNTCLSIRVDVDGPGKGKNTIGQDIFTINIYKTGKVSVPDGGIEYSYLTK